MPRFAQDRGDAFASKPAPTGDMCRSQSQCGSGLARESDRTGTEVREPGARRRAPADPSVHRRIGHWASFCFMGLAKSESYVARKTVIASRLAPTLDPWRTQIPCGSQPAGDGSDAVEPIEPYSMSLKDLLPDADHQRKKNPAFAGFFVRPTEAAHSAA